VTIKPTPEMFASLLDSADNLDPHKMAADLACIDRDTLLKWRKATDGELGAFAREYARRRAMAARPKLQQAWDKDPVTMASRILGVSNPPEKREIKDTTEDITRLPDDELDAKLAELGYQRVNPRSETNVEIKAKPKARSARRLTDGDDD
jgi:hypothetical protein